MKIKLECPHASYGAGMKIRCAKLDGGLCPHQYFRSCKGWWALTDRARECPMKREEKKA